MARPDQTQESEMATEQDQSSKYRAPCSIHGCRPLQPSTSTVSIIGSDPQSLSHSADTCCASQKSVMNQMALKLLVEWKEAIACQCEYRSLEAPLPTLSRPSGEGRSRLPEEDLADEGLRPRSRVVRVDADDQRLDLLVGLLAIDLLVVFADIARSHEPLSQVRLARTHNDIGHEARLLTLDRDAGRRRRVPDIDDHAGAHRGREPGERDVDLRRLVVRRLLAGVAALGQHRGLPVPLEDGVVLAVDLDVFVDGGAVSLAQEAKDVPRPFAHDLEVVHGNAPAL